jgi:hypothetical protein
MSRKGLEFKASVKLEMFRRAGGPENVCCEGCGMRLGGKPFDYDHTVEVWELPDELRREFRKHGVPAEYGKLLGHCCHAPKTARKAAERAKCNKVIKSVAKVKKPSRPMPGSRASGWKKTFNNGWERR